MGLVIAFTVTGVTFAKRRSSGRRSGILDGQVVIRRDNNPFGFRIILALYRVVALTFLIGALFVAAVPL